MQQTQPRVKDVNAFAAGTMAVALRRSERAFLLALAHSQVQQRASIADPDSSTPWPVSLAKEPTSYNWPALAICETGANTSMHGPVYSSMYGVMDEAVRENSPPDVAERILNGTASVAEQTAMAESVAAKHGIHSWGCWRSAVG